ncbi:MAG TPA: biotin-dependent carboxyltransferase family protein, partial [Cryptosporangiaceae bacterium]|nr:biotin-dependent carboxyltransferase family protein [Cryptosporangiaceae bacterium]
AVEPVLGSRSTDTLSGLGPPTVGDRMELPVGPAAAGEPATPDAEPDFPAEPRLPITPGPRADWFAEDALDVLGRAVWTVTPASNRVGVRLDGPSLARRVTAELPSEGLVAGAIQVPPGSGPVLFLADHPVTGGYPVLAVVDPADLWLAAQARPGETLRFGRTAHAGR